MTDQPADHADSSDECERTRRHAHEYLDGELEESLTLAFVQHIGKCSDCGHRITFEGAFLRTVARACSSETLPTEVREQIASLVFNWRGRNT